MVTWLSLTDSSTTIDTPLSGDLTVNASLPIALTLGLGPR